MTPTLSLARRIAETRYQHLPSPALTVARQALMDFIGVACAGINEPLSRLLRDDAAESGGHAQARLIGTPDRASVQQAALINGAAGHAHDYDDVHTAMNGHPTVPVAPVVLALGEQLGADGKRLLQAFCAGVDTECILGRYAGPAHYADGWHNTGTLGTFGAAAAAANLLGFDTAQTAIALGIAGTRAAGLKAQFGTMCKPLHAGHAAATGVHSARLAGAGFTGRPDILEADQGFMSTQCRTADVERFEEAMRTPAYTPGICFKYHAACYLTHSAIESALGLCADHGLTPKDIESVEIRVDPGHLKVCNIQTPTTGLEAKFSLRFVTAMALAGVDTAGIETYTDALTAREDLVRLRDQVTVVAAPGRTPDTVLTIRTPGGSLERTENVAVPLTDLDVQWRKLSAKFLSLATPSIGRAAAEDLVDACRRLGDGDDALYVRMSAPGGAR